MVGASVRALSSRYSPLRLLQGSTVTGVPIDTNSNTC